MIAGRGSWGLWRDFLDGRNDSKSLCVGNVLGGKWSGGGE